MSPIHTDHHRRPRGIHLERLADGVERPPAPSTALLRSGPFGHAPAALGR